MTVINKTKTNNNKKEEERNVLSSPLVLVACHQLSSVQFSVVQDSVYALGKAHNYAPQPSLSLPNVAFETVPIFV